MKKDMGIMIITLALVVIVCLYIKSDEFKEFTSGHNKQETSIEESESEALQTEEVEHQNEMVPNMEEYKEYYYYFE